MAFVDQLGANSGPPIRSGVYGQPSPTDNQDTLSLVNQLKDREMMDFKNKAEYMADLSIRQQQRMRSMFGPDSMGGQNLANRTTVDTGEAPGQPSPDSLSSSPLSKLNPQQRLDYGLKQQELGQKERFGQEALDVKSAQEKLNQQKSDQIHEQKVNELQQKHDKAISDLDLANRKLQANTTDHQAHIDFLKAKQDADEARHNLDSARRDKQLDETKRMDDAKIQDLQDKLKQAQHTSVKTKLDASDNEKTVETTRGDAAETVDVLGKDGKPYTIPKDKLNDMDSDGTPHWKQVGGGDQQPQTEDNNDATGS